MPDAPAQVLVVDVETTGTSPETDRVVEVAAALYNVRIGTSIQSFSTLVQGDTNAAESVNGIAPAALAFGMPFPVACTGLMRMADKAQCIVAHSCDFDRSFLPSLHDRRWVCSMRDISWPKSCSSRALTSLALAHGLAVFEAHRAYTDVDLLVRLFNRVVELGHDLGAMLAQGLRPRATYIANVSYDDRQRAKESGFEWDAVRRVWWRRMLPEDAAALPFPTQVVLDERPSEVARAASAG